MLSQLKMERGDQEKGEKREDKERKGRKERGKERGRKRRKAGLSLHMAILYYMILEEFSCI